MVQDWLFALISLLPLPAVGLKDSVEGQALHTSRGMVFMESQALHTSRGMVFMEGQALHTSRGMVFMEGQALHTSCKVTFQAPLPATLLVATVCADRSVPAYGVHLSPESDRPAHGLARYSASGSHS